MGLIRPLEIKFPSLLYIWNEARILNWREGETEREREREKERERDRDQGYYMVWFAHSHNHQCYWDCHNTPKYLDHPIWVFQRLIGKLIHPSFSFLNLQLDPWLNVSKMLDWQHFKYSRSKETKQSWLEMMGSGLKWLLHQSISNTMLLFLL